MTMGWKQVAWIRTVSCGAALIALVGCAGPTALLPPDLEQMIVSGRVLRAQIDTDGSIRGHLRDETAFTCTTASMEETRVLIDLMRSHHVDLAFLSASVWPASRGVWGLLRSVR
jgi:hypothetical protein